MKAALQSDSASFAPVELEIIAALRSIKFGKVEVTVHDSQVVQLETTEKVRFSLTKSLSPAGPEEKRGR